MDLWKWKSEKSSEWQYFPQPCLPGAGNAHCACGAMNTIGPWLGRVANGWWVAGSSEEGAGQSDKAKFIARAPAWEQAGVLGWISRSQQGKSTDPQKVTYLRSLWLGTQKHWLIWPFFFFSWPSRMLCKGFFLARTLNLEEDSAACTFFTFFEVEGLTMQWFTAPLGMQNVGAYGSECLKVNSLCHLPSIAPIGKSYWVLTWQNLNVKHVKDISENT